MKRNDVYSYLRRWFAYAAEHPEVNQSDTALFFYIINRFNIMHWPESIELSYRFMSNNSTISTFETIKKSINKLTVMEAITVTQSADNNKCTQIMLGKWCTSFSNRNPIGKPFEKPHGKSNGNPNRNPNEYNNTNIYNKENNTNTISNPDCGLSQSVAADPEPIKPKKEKKQPNPMVKVFIDTFTAWYESRFDANYFFNGVSDAVAAAKLQRYFDTYKGENVQQRASNELFEAFLNTYDKWSEFQRRNPTLKFIGNNIASIIATIKQDQQFTPGKYGRFAKEYESRRFDELQAEHLERVLQDSREQRTRHSDNN